MQITPRNRLILTIAGAVVLVGLAVAFILRPGIVRWEEADKRVRESDAKIAEARNVLAVRQEAKQRSSQTNARYLRLLTAVPENPDLPALIIEMQNLANHCGLQIRMVEPGDLEQRDRYSALPITLQVWGSWGDTVDFLQQLTTLEREVRIISASTRVLDANAASGATAPLASGAVDTTLLLETYVIPSNAASMTAVPAPAGQ